MPSPFGLPNTHAPLLLCVWVHPQSAVAFANIGELAVDALITTLQLPLAAYCEDDNVLPCVGNDAYSSSACGELAMPLELFGLPEQPPRRTGLAQVGASRGVYLRCHGGFAGGGHMDGKSMPADAPSRAPSPPPRI